MKHQLIFIVLSGLALGGACAVTGLAPQATLDGGSEADSGVITDSGLPVDAGPSIDAGQPMDAGTHLDAGVHRDAGTPHDGGSPHDAGTAIDGGCAGDGGCGFGRMCCDGECVNADNDPDNCGTCGTHCSGTKSYCTNNMCEVPPCTIDGGRCAASGGSCCGNICCASGDLCCDSEGPVSGFPQCYTPTSDAPTCPQGCAPSCVSDRDAKRDFEPADDRAVLDALSKLPMSTWSYKDGKPSVRHIGPTAQDFQSAFGVGGTDKGYDPVDAHGVALSSIRALYSIVKEQEARIDRLELENERLRRSISRNDQPNLKVK